MKQGPFVTFNEDLSGKSKLTRVWAVQAINSLGFPLGKVKWWSAWRRYCFFPCKDTVYDANCLWDIADFCARMTTEQKEAQAARRRK